MMKMEMPLNAMIAVVARSIARTERDSRTFVRLYCLFFSVFSESCFFHIENAIWSGPCRRP